jgi:adenylate cyclase
MPKLFYLPDNREVDAELDDTLLQASLKNGILHTQVCGGSARWSTCRVIVLEGLANCSAPRNEKERPYR